VSILPRSLLVLALVIGGIAAPAAAQEEIGDVDEDEDGEESGLVFRARVTGDYRLRSNLMSEIPLTEGPGDPTGESGVLGQQFWVNQWLRLGGELALDPIFRVVGEMDILDGVLLGEFTRGVQAAQRPRDDVTAIEGFDPRALYLEWRSPFGPLAAGLMTTHWGLGTLVNDGAHEPVFGDYRYGDVMIRLLMVAELTGEGSPFKLAVAGDVVYDDMRAQLVDGDQALQGLIAAFYEEDRRSLGLYGLFRTQRRDVQSSPVAYQEVIDTISVDAFARWDFPEPSGGRIEAALEASFTFGTSTAHRTVEETSQDVRQWVLATQVGRRGATLDVVLEGGWTSGDADPTDGVQSRGTMHPDHRVGLVMFPETLAWQTARSATLMLAPDIAGRPVPGARFHPTNGGVAGAVYAFPHVIARPLEILDLRFGMVVAVATSDIVDPYRFYFLGDVASFRGGDPRARDLGLELDGSLLLHGDIARGVTLRGGLELGVHFPGHAFDDAAGNGMNPVALLRVLAGLTF